MEKPPQKPVDPPRRLFPGLVTSGVILFLLAAVVFLHLQYDTVEVGGLDQAAANLGTWVALVLGAFTLWLWFCFRSTYAVGLRRGVMIAGTALGLMMMSTVRLEGIDGNWIPTGVRWSWQKSRDYERTKPVAAASKESSEGESDPSTTGDRPEPRIIAATPGDFPQFLGPHRDGYLPDAKLSQDWKAQPPQVLWRREVGAGWSGFAVVADHAVTLEQYGGEELITCRDLNSGDTLWTHSDAARHEEFMGGIGPRSTPTIHDSKVYTLGATGILNCLDLATGKPIWSHKLREEFGVSDAEDAQLVMWGRANSPLVYGDLCIVPAGGKPAVSLVAYDKQSGEKRWTAGSTQISYASPTVMHLAGRDQIVSVNENNVTGHDPSTGAQLWSFDWPGRSSMNASASQAHQVDDNRVFISKGYDEGSAVFTVADLGGSLNVEQVWKEKRSLQTKFTNAVLVGGQAYGLSDGVLQCVDLANGKRLWTSGRYGHGQILGAGDVLLVQTEKTGEIVMVAIDPKKHRELGKFQALGRQSQAWNNLGLAGKKLLMRNADEAVCLELP